VAATLTLPPLPLPPPRDAALQPPSLPLPLLSPLAIGGVRRRQSHPVDARVVETAPRRRHSSHHSRDSGAAGPGHGVGVGVGVGVVGVGSLSQTYPPRASAVGAQQASRRRHDAQRRRGAAVGEPRAAAVDRPLHSRFGGSPQIVGIDIDVDTVAESPGGSRTTSRGSTAAVSTSTSPRVVLMHSGEEVRRMPQPPHRERPCARRRPTRRAAVHEAPRDAAMPHVVVARTAALLAGCVSPPLRGDAERIAAADAVIASAVRAIEGVHSNAFNKVCLRVGPWSGCLRACSFPHTCVALCAMRADARLAERRPLRRRRRRANDPPGVAATARRRVGPSAAQ
jgi:hypothetical protein